MTDEYEKEDDEEYEDEEATSKSDEEYEDEAEDAEASDESEDEDSVASWGYEDKKSRLSKEVLAGFAAIAVLVALFGIVVYKKMPGAGDSSEVATAGPEASLGNPEGTLGGPEGEETSPAEDPDDPFREGAENSVVVGDLGRQTEPGQDDGTPNASLGGSEFTDPNLTSDGSPGFASGDTSSDQFVNSDSLGGDEPFASNSETPDLFSGQSDTGLTSNSEPPSGTLSTGASTAFPNDGSSEFADSSRPDPFGGPDLTNGTNSTYPETGSTNFSASQPAGDPFPQGDQFSKNEPGIDGSLNNSPAGDSASALQPELGGGSNEFHSPASNEPFGSNTGVGESGPAGLFDRGAGSSLDGGSRNDPSSTGLSNNPDLGSGTLSGSEFGSIDNNGVSGSGSTFDNGPETTSASPSGSDELFGTSSTGSADSVFATPETTSTNKDPFGTPTSTASNDSFPGSTSEPSTGFGSGNGLDSRPDAPVNLFPDTNALPTSTASNEPFQSPSTSSPDSSFPGNSASPVTSGPFGNEALSTDSSAGQSMFASQPGNSGTYTVQDGDSYWTISKKVYGTAKYFQLLADHNRRTIADPQKMKAGVVIEIPPASVLQGKLKTVRRTVPTGLAGRIEPSGRADGAGSSHSSNSASSAAESVVVSRRGMQSKEPSGILFNQQGYPLYRIGETDTLTSIASDHLGRASRWQQVYNMNRDQLQSPDKLQIGMLLKLPSDASRVPLVDRTSSLR